MAIFIESEIWPSMFLSINKRSIPLLLMNARITQKTFKSIAIHKLKHDIITACEETEDVLK